jgi:hypothetical protein
MADGLPNLESKSEPWRELWGRKWLTIAESLLELDKLTLFEQFPTIALDMS